MSKKNYNREIVLSYLDNHITIDPKYSSIFGDETTTNVWTNIHIWHKIKYTYNMECKICSLFFVS